MKARRLPFDMYNRAVTFVYGSVDEINRYIKRHCPVDHVDLTPDAAGYWKCYMHDGHQADFICLVQRGTAAERHAVIAHEALHFVAHTLRKAGMPLTDETEEAYTYYLGYIVKACTERM